MILILWFASALNPGGRWLGVPDPSSSSSSLKLTNNNGVPIASGLIKNPSIAVESPKTSSTSVSASPVKDVRQYNQSFGYIGGPAYYGKY